MELVSDEAVIELPDGFECPLSLQCMRDPVVTQAGVSYERTAIEGWFNRGKKTDPATGVILESLVLYRNVNLKKCIDAFLEKQITQDIEKRSTGPIDKLGDIGIGDDKWTMFHDFAYKNDISQMQILLMQKNEGLIEKINSENRKGWTPLNLAIVFGSQRMMALLIEHGALVLSSKTISNKVLPIHLACQYGDLSKVQYLIDHGARESVSCVYQYKNVSQKIFDLGKDGGITPLAIAVRYADISVIRLLLMNGAIAVVNKYANLYYFDSNDWLSDYTPVHIALRYRDSKIVELLVEYGADLKFCVTGLLFQRWATPSNQQLIKMNPENSIELEEWLQTKNSIEFGI